MLYKKLLLTLSALLLLVFEAQAQVELVLWNDSTTIKQNNEAAWAIEASDSLIFLQVLNYTSYPNSSRIYTACGSGFYSLDNGQSWIKSMSCRVGAVSGKQLVGGGGYNLVSSINFGRTWETVTTLSYGVFDSYRYYSGVAMSYKNDSIFSIREEGPNFTHRGTKSLYFFCTDLKSKKFREYGTIGINTSVEGNKSIYSVTGATFMMIGSTRLLRMGHDTSGPLECQLSSDSVKVMPRSIIETQSGTMLVGTEQGLYRSRNYGDTWEKVKMALPERNSWVHSFAKKANRVFAALAPSDEIWASDDNGSIWNRLRIRKFPQVRQISVVNDYLFVLANDSLWRVPLSALSPLGLAHTPSESALSCTPSPLSNAGLVKYRAKEAGFVTMEVVDVLGRTVKKIFEGVVSSEPHQYSLSVEDLPSGVYQIIARSASTIQAKKITVIK